MKNDSFHRTDLALELQEELNPNKTGNRTQAKAPGCPEKNYTDDYVGYSVQEKARKGGRIREVTVTIKNAEGEQLFGKPQGTYLTLESADLSKNDGAYHEDMSSLLAEHLEHFMKGRKQILFAGLGNAEVTPDALGPLVIKNLLITRHLHSLPFFEKMRSSMAIAPGVMAQTGMETSELLKGMIARCRPDMLLVIDALAAKTAGRLNRTVQITDTGIMPGSGVGNRRKEISEHTMNIPVLAIGVPTVISMPFIAREIVGSFLTSQGENNLLTRFEHWSEREQYDLMGKIMREDLFSLTVTPKDIDANVKRISYTISEGINRTIARKTE